MRQAGLILFIAVQVLNALGLLLDGVLLLAGRQTITDRVEEHPLWGLPVLALQAASFAGLAVHFYEDTIVTRSQLLALLRGAAIAAGSAALVGLSHYFAGADIGPFGLVLSSGLTWLALHLSQAQPPSPPPAAPAVPAAPPTMIQRPADKPS